MLARRRRRCPRCESAKLRVTEDMIPDPQKKGVTFKRFCSRLRNLGYAIEFKELVAADYGAPTSRNRLFLVARCDGQPIVWPAATHVSEKRKLQTHVDLPTWRPAADVIDWSLPCHSIFLTKEEGKTAGVKRPLADKTLRRIALGIQRYVLDSPNPFVVQCNHGGDGFRGYALDSPLPTLTAARDAHGLVVPYMTRLCQNGSNGNNTSPLTNPLTTVVSKNEHCITVSTLLEVAYGDDGRRGDGTKDIQQPLGTIHAGGNNFAMATSILIQTGYGEAPGQLPRVPGLDKPLGTVVSSPKHALVAATLTKFRGESVGHSLREPLPTVTSGSGAARPAGAAHAMGLGAVNLVQFNHGDKQWHGLDRPLTTVTAQGLKFGLVCAFMTQFNGASAGFDPGEPLNTITAGVRKFGVTTLELSPGVMENAVWVNLPGYGTFVIADILLRMLKPHELAAGQGFPKTYILTGSQSNQVAKIGNSVSPPVAAAIVRANYTPQRRRQPTRLVPVGRRSTPR